MLILVTMLIVIGRYILRPFSVAIIVRNNLSGIYLTRRGGEDCSHNISILREYLAHRNILYSIRVLSRVCFLHSIMNWTSQLSGNHSTGLYVSWKVSCCNFGTWTVRSVPTWWKLSEYRFSLNQKFPNSNYINARSTGVVVRA